MNASRVVVDTGFPEQYFGPNFGPSPTITEFPFFTILYGDPHAHLFALPITLLVLAFALSVVLIPPLARLAEAETSRLPEPGKLAWVTDLTQSPPPVPLLTRGDYFNHGPANRWAVRTTGERSRKSCDGSVASGLRSGGTTRAPNASGVARSARPGNRRVRGAAGRRLPAPCCEPPHQ